jgi:hypothetical protein
MFSSSTSTDLFSQIRGKTSLKYMYTYLPNHRERAKHAKQAGEGAKKAQLMKNNKLEGITITICI